MSKAIKNRWWRPCKFSRKIVKKLIDIFKIDWTIEEACSYAGISKQTFYNRLEEIDGFLDEITEAKQFKFIYAKQKLFKSMDSKNDAVSQKWALEFLTRRHPDYKDKKSDVTINNTPRFSCIEIIDATWEATNSTNTETKDTSE
jgi:hypothetical protein